MKEPLYNILDGEYCFLLDRITKIFQEKGLNPTIVGGAAVQVHVADLLSKIYGKDIERLFIGDGDPRQQDYLRNTDDIDFAVYNKPLEKDSAHYQKYILDTIGEIVCENVESPDGNDLYDVLMKRRGLKRPILLVTSLNKISEVKLNVSNSPRDRYHLDPKTYLSMIKDGVTIKLNYSSNFKPQIRVSNLEDLLASKVIHNRAKDQFDAAVLGRSALLAKRKIDKEKVRGIAGKSKENIERINDYFENLKKSN